MNFEKEGGVCDCVPAMPKETIKDITGINYKMLCEINVVLSAIEAEIFGVDANKLSDPEEGTLEAALIGTNKILNNILGRLQQFANRMGVDT